MVKIRNPLKHKSTVGAKLFLLPIEHVIYGLVIPRLILVRII